MEPVGAGQELVGEGVSAEEVDQPLELGRILRTDISCLADEVLGIVDASDLSIDCLAAEA